MRINLGNADIIFNEPPSAAQIMGRFKVPRKVKKKLKKLGLYSKNIVLKSVEMRYE